MCRNRFLSIILLIASASCLIAQQGVAVLDFAADIVVEDAQLRQAAFSEEELLTFPRKGVPGLLQDILSDYIPVVEREQLSRILEKLEAETSDLFDQATVVQVDGWVGARYSVMGSWVKLGDILTLRARMVDNATGVILASEDGSVRLAEPETMLDLAGRIGRKLLAGVGVQVEAVARLTESVEALKEYSQAVAASDRGDREGAEEHARVALALDPGFQKARKYVRGTTAELQKLVYHAQVVSVETELKTELGHWLRETKSMVVWTPLIVTTIFGGALAIANSFHPYTDVDNAKILAPGLIISGIGIAGSLISYPKTKTEKITYLIDDTTGEVVNILCLQYLRDKISLGVIRQPLSSGPPNPKELNLKDVGEIVPFDKDGFYLCRYDYVIEPASKKYPALKASFHYRVQHDGAHWTFADITEEEYLNYYVNRKFGSIEENQASGSPDRMDEGQYPSERAMFWSFLYSSP